VEILAQPDGEVRIIAGGTALVPTLRLGLVTPERMVSLHRIAGLSEICVDKGALDIGAMVTLAAVARHDGLRSGWPLLAQAAGRVATRGHTKHGDARGNLCYAEAASDPAPAPLCLDAQQVRVADSMGERVVPIGEFFTGFYETAIAPGEVLVGVKVPAAPPGARSGYVKFCPRSAEDKPLIGVAALLLLGGSKRVAEIRIALGGAGPTPMRARAAEAALRAQDLSDHAIRAAADAAAGEAAPLSDLMGSADYRREMIRVWVRRLLIALGEGRAIA
jgi:carbon-monoxide dehydrogenase medium subunit